MNSLLRILLFVSTFWAVGCKQQCDEKSVKSGDTTQVANKQSSEAIKDSLQLFFEQFLSDTIFRNATIACKIQNAANDSVILDYNSNLTLIPASTLKILTTAAALEILGENASFRTSLQYEGKIENRILKGNLIIKGGGDPTFGINLLNKSSLFDRWIAEIKKLGIDSITGFIIGDGKIFDKDITPYTWTWGEINEGYCAAASGLSIYGNIFQMGFDPEKKGEFEPSDKKMTPKIPGVKYENRSAPMNVDEEDLYIIGLPYGNQFTLRGVVPKGKKEAVVEGAIHNPPLIVAQELANALREAGIKAGRGCVSLADNDSLDRVLEKKERKHIVSTSSPSVASIVYTTNQISYNFFAEALLKHCGLKKYGYGSTESGAKAVYEFWKEKGMDISGMFIYDGSGISRFNGLTAGQLNFALSAIRKSNYFQTFFNSLAIAGKTGTLRKMCNRTAGEGRVFAKSGTMSRVKSYAGYVKSTSGKELIFSIIINNYQSTPLTIKEKIAAFFDFLAKY